VISRLPTGLADLLSSRPLTARKIARGLWAAGQNRLIKIVPPRLRLLGGELKAAPLGAVLNRRRDLSARLGAVDRVVFLLTGPPITSTGGGQRTAQMALALLRLNNLVVFVSRWTDNGKVTAARDMAHPLLFTYSLRTFDLDAFLRRYPEVGAKPATAVVQIPKPKLIELGEKVKARGGTLVYECLDDWRSRSLGGSWYSVEAERRLLASSDVVTASSEPLREWLAELGGRRVVLIPNGVNTEVFRPDIPNARPADLPLGEFVITYVGTLWGDWFDWDLLRKVAAAYPHARVVVIGEYRGQCPDPSPNLHFLGLKLIRELPAYLAHTDVAIIPWKISRLTHAVNPVKVYEYIAMRKPVVAPRIRGLDGIPYVMPARDDEEFIANIKAARELRIDRDVVAAFVSENSWNQRASTLMSLL
jgi:glycosyltransferase involved in cell wall biosynthesis